MRDKQDRRDVAERPSTQVCQLANFGTPALSLVILPHCHSKNSCLVSRRTAILKGRSTSISQQGRSRSGGGLRALVRRHGRPPTAKGLAAGRPAAAGEEDLGSEGGFRCAV